MKKISKVLGAIACAFFLALSGVMLSACGDNAKPKLKIYHDFKTEYAVGESLDITGGVLLYTNENGDEKHVNIETSMVISFDTSTAGNKKMFISYKDCEITVNYLVYNDVECENVTYYANPGYLGSGTANPEKYDYYYFKSKTELLAMSTSDSVNNVNKSSFEHASSISLTSSLVNGKMVYVGTVPGTTNQIKITVISDSKISIVIDSGAISLNYEANKTNLN